MRVRLADSLDHLGEVLEGREGSDHGLPALREGLQQGPVSPWVYALYAKLVAEMETDDAGLAASALVRSLSRPRAEGLVRFDDPNVPPEWWDHLRVLFDTDAN